MKSISFSLLSSVALSLTIIVDRTSLCNALQLVGHENAVNATGINATLPIIPSTIGEINQTVDTVNGSQTNVTMNPLKDNSVPGTNNTGNAGETAALSAPKLPETLTAEGKLQSLPHPRLRPQDALINATSTDVPPHGGGEANGPEGGAAGLPPPPLPQFSSNASAAPNASQEGVQKGQLGMESGSTEEIDEEFPPPLDD